MADRDRESPMDFQWVSTTMADRGRGSPIDFQRISRAMAHRGRGSPMDFQRISTAISDRGRESPMDFQWEGSGPGDPNSPFMAARNFANDGPAKKRIDSFFQSSPIKAPTLSPLASQSFLSSTPYGQAPHTPHSIRPPPQPIFKTPSFTTPRYAFDTPSRDSDIFSENTPRTPDVNSEVSTPKTPRTSCAEVKGAKSTAVILASPTPSRTTSQGELQRGIFHDDIATKARRRRHQFPSHDFSTSGTGVLEDEGEDEGQHEGDTDFLDGGGDLSPTDTLPPRQSWRRTAKSAATQWVATHRELPLIASRYLQLFFNLSLLLLVLYALFCFYLTIRRDVDQKVEVYSDAILAEISLCSRSFIENRCAPHMRVPAMEARCNAWENCMNRDPSQVGRARVSAETFAEIINSFIEPISYKTMFFCLLLVFGGLFVSNTAFGFYRAKAVEHPAPYISPAVPPTPSQWERQAQQQLIYESMPRSPAPSTPVRTVGYQGRTPGRTGGRERMTGRKDSVWR